MKWSINNHDQLKRSVPCVVLDQWNMWCGSNVYDNILWKTFKSIPQLILTCIVLEEPKSIRKNVSNTNSNGAIGTDDW